MDKEAMRERAAAVLSAWNSHDVDRVVACYTEDCIYCDPNTRGAVAGREELRRYLTRLFQDWRMHWSLREFFAFADGSGGAFLWDAGLTPAAGGAMRAPDGRPRLPSSGRARGRDPPSRGRECGASRVLRRPGRAAEPLAQCDRDPRPRPRPRARPGGGRRARARRLARPAAW